MQRYLIKTPGGQLRYDIAHRKRVRKRLHMELNESGGLVVIAPRHWSEKQVAGILEQNSSKVERFLHRARQRRLPPLQYRHGELHLLMGRRFPLKIKVSAGKKSTIIHTDSGFLISTSDSSPSKIQSLMQSWYQQQAYRVFDERLKAVAARAEWVGTKQIPLKLRRMKRTWGNCSSSGVIKLNTHLIKAPVALIDSVIAHELCHLEEMNHGRAFYQLLEKLNPDWKKDRQQLVSEGSQYLV